MSKHYFPFENHYSVNIEAPQLSVVECEGGLFPCDVDKAAADEAKNDSLSQYYSFLEVHKTTGWALNGHVFEDEYKSRKKIVIRISNWSRNRGIQLHECVILNKESATQLRDLLNTLVEQM